MRDSPNRRKPVHHFACLQNFDPDMSSSLTHTTAIGRFKIRQFAFPCSTLDNQPPLVAFPEAHHSGRSYRPEWEASLMNLQHVYDYLAQGRWFRRSTEFGQFYVGGYSYSAGKHFKDQTLEITFDLDACGFCILSENGQRKTYLAAQGLSKTELMGELGPLIALPAYQLALPFSRSAWRQILLAADLAGTTFRDFQGI
jgi:hypothetical protein